MSSSPSTNSVASTYTNINSSSLAEISSMEELQAVVHSGMYLAVVVLGRNSWSGPCKTIAPIMEDLASKYSTTSNGAPAVKFLVFDVDEADELASSLGIEATPTCLFYKGRDKTVERLEGGNAAALEKRVKECLDMINSGNTSSTNQESSTNTASNNPHNNSDSGSQGPPRNASTATATPLANPGSKF